MRLTNKYLKKKLKGGGGEGVPLSLSNLFDISSQFFVVEKVGLSSLLVENYCTSLMSNFLIR
jgi:hypothetical protein